MVFTVNRAIKELIKDILIFDENFSLGEYDKNVISVFQLMEFYKERYNEYHKYLNTLIDFSEDENLSNIEYMVDDKDNSIHLVLDFKKGSKCIPDGGRVILYYINGEFKFFRSKKLEYIYHKNLCHECLKPHHVQRIDNEMFSSYYYVNIFNEIVNYAINNHFENEFFKVNSISHSFSIENKGYGISISLDFPLLKNTDKYLDLVYNYDQSDVAFGDRMSIDFGNIYLQTNVSGMKKMLSSNIEVDDGKGTNGLELLLSNMYVEENLVSKNIVKSVKIRRKEFN